MKKLEANEVSFYPKGHPPHRKWAGSWSQEEEDIIKEHGENRTGKEMLKFLPRRTAKSISSKRNRMGIAPSYETKSRAAAEGRAKVNLDNLRKSDHSLSLETLDNTTLQVLIGTLLGDGCCKHPKTNFQRRGTKGQVYANRQLNSHFYMSHGEAQKSWLEWKIKILNQFFFHETLNPRHRKGCKTHIGNMSKDTTKFEISSVSHPIFTQLRELIYCPPIKSGKRPPSRHKAYLPEDIINRLDMLGLLIWYLDDGAVNKRKRLGARRVTDPTVHYRDAYQLNKAKKGWIRIEGLEEWAYYGALIACKGFKLSHLERASKIINKNLGLNTKISISTHPYPCAHLPEDGSINKIIRLGNTEEMKKIFAVWRELAVKYEIPESMLYKIPTH